MVAAISKAFLVTSLPDGNSTLKVSESVKVSSQQPLHFLAICPTEDPVSSSIYNSKVPVQVPVQTNGKLKSYLKWHISSTTSTRTTGTRNSKQFGIMLILNLQFHIGTTPIGHFTDFANHLLFVLDL